MSKPIMKIYRVMVDKPHYTTSKPLDAHYMNKAEAMKIAQSLQLRADKHTRYHVDSVEVY